LRLCKAAFCFLDAAIVSAAAIALTKNARAMLFHGHARASRYAVITCSAMGRVYRQNKNGQAVFLPVDTACVKS